MSKNLCFASSLQKLKKKNFGTFEEKIFERLKYEVKLS